MKTMSVIFKVFAFLGFAASFFCIAELETFIILLSASITLLAAGVLFEGLRNAFEDIAIIRERQKLELIHKGIIKEE